MSKRKPQHAPLTDREAKFVHEWLSSFNAVEAARKAGYGRTYNAIAVTGHRLLRSAKIRHYLDRHLRDSQFGPEQVKARLAELANNGPGNLMTEDGRVNIRKLRAKPWLCDSYQAAGKTTGEKITTPSSLEALKTIAHYHGMLKGDRSQAGEDSGPTVIVVQVAPPAEPKQATVEVESEAKQIGDGQ
jgi:phage terminase small subunit